MWRQIKAMGACAMNRRKFAHPSFNPRIAPTFSTVPHFVVNCSMSRGFSYGRQNSPLTGSMGPFWTRRYRIVPYLAVVLLHLVDISGFDLPVRLWYPPLLRLSLSSQEPSSCRPRHLPSLFLRYSQILLLSPQPNRRLEDPRLPRPASVHDLN